MRAGFPSFMALMLLGCGGTGFVEGSTHERLNPFLDPALFQATGGFRELEVSVEAELESPGWELLFAPGDALWFAATELRRRHGLELGFPADEALEPARLEWLLDGVWLPTDAVPPDSFLRLGRFRLRGARAWAFGRAAQLVQPGQAYRLTVPRRPYRLVEDAGASCAEGGRLPAAGTYWSVWAPERPDCRAPRAELELRIERAASASAAAYPEYDALRADGELRVAVVFLPRPEDGLAPQGGAAWQAAEALGAELLAAGFLERPGLSRGRRFTRATGALGVQVDAIYPDLLAALADPAALLDWRRAFAEAEALVVVGAPGLPAGFSFAELALPDTYQVVATSALLEPDALARPLAAGGYGRLDLVGAARAHAGDEPRALATGLVAGLVHGALGEDLTWGQILGGVERLGGAPLVASGIQGNCYSPWGSRCADEVAPERLRFEDARPLSIPDGDPAGASAAFEVVDARLVRAARVEVAVEHPYPGDLEIALEHDGRVFAIWSHQVTGQRDVRLGLDAAAFAGGPAGGLWRLRLADTSALDAGRLVRWALELEVVAPASPAVQ